MRTCHTLNPNCLGVDGRYSDLDCGGVAALCNPHSQDDLRGSLASSLAKSTLILPYRFTWSLGCIAEFEARTNHNPSHKGYSSPVA